MQVAEAADITPFWAEVCNDFGPVSGKNHGFRVAMGHSLHRNGTLIALHLAAKRDATSGPLENGGTENALKCRVCLLSVNTSSLY